MEKQFNLLIDTKRTGFNTVRGLKQGDNNSVLNITLVQNSIPFNLENCTVRINYKRPDNKIFLQMADIVNATEGKVKINILTKVLESVGEVKTDLSIFDTNNRKITSVTFNMFVEASVYTNDYLELEDLDVIQGIYVKENERINNEKIRVENEDIRKFNEELRQENENIRVNKEDERITQENERVESETIRQAKEKERVENEETRQANEEKRQSDEITRQANEEKRQSDEITRQQNEENRKQTQLDMQKVITNINEIEPYETSKTYNKLNRVTYNGSSYEAVKDVPINTPPTNTMYWICIAEKGKDGKGSGNMHTDVYDKNNDGIVDVAETANNVDWSNIQNKPDLSHANFDRKTYSELKVLKDSSQLKEGKRYILTDYRTKYRQPDTNVIKEMEVEELILTASSINTFEPIVYSSKYPQDTIWYDFDNNKCEDNTTPRNGFITRRHDTVDGNNCPQDWRTMLWARWRPDENQYYKNDVLTNYEVWTSGNAKMGVIYKAGNKLLVAKNTNVPSKVDDDNVFDIIYKDITIGMLRADKTKILSQTTDTLELKKGELHERLTFGDSCSKNVIGDCGLTPHNNVFGNSCYSNSFGNYCYSNSLGNNCSYNSFGNSCYSNSFGNYCYSNSLGNSCYSNSLGNGCSSNSFGNYCYSNSFGNYCNSNSFGNSCYSNSFGNYCYSNSLGNSCNSNSFGNSCYSNSFGNYCYSNSLGNSCDNIYVKDLRNKNMINLDIYSKNYTINIEKNNNGQYVFWYINSSNQPVYTPIP
ncbi:BppU family phage baseplate upper protein [Clostridium tepidum]|uniref:BppU family phage baseplate upper protein n=1 Tax=Clostridium tepidum TaxID=1962263 RepID=UPI002149E1CF|nr:BppU family phage baseplate upper protein [Clostridium tepidum]MCR1933518.1 BppU family phage baseplate upper protein [Clostridium tepidum]